MRIYIKNNIYFNVVVSQYFCVPFNNQGENIDLIASTVLNCSVVSWDIDTRKILSELADQEISLLGRGTGEWEIFADQVVQHAPDTSKWNETEDDPQKENGRSASRDLDGFIRSVNMLFI